MTKAVTILSTAMPKSAPLAPSPEELRPISREVICIHSPEAKAAEAVRGLSRQVEVHVNKGARSFALVADAPQRGTSFLACNLAVCCARNGLDTVLIDANLNAPRQAAFFGIPRDVPGLSDWLRSKHPLQVRSQFGVIRLPNLAIIPAGTGGPGEALLEHVNFSSIVAGMARAFQVTIIDSPSMAHEAGAMAVIGSADRTLIVARQDHTSISGVQALERMVQQCHGEVAGTVLTRF